MKTLKDDEAKRAYRIEVATKNPQLYAAIIAIVQERGQASLAASDQTSDRMQRAAATNQATNEVLSEAMLRVAASDNK